MNDKEYYISRPDGTQEGPYSEEQLVSRINAGKYAPDTLVWTEGMDDWAELRSLFSSPTTQETEQPSDKQNNTTTQTNESPPTSHSSSKVRYKLKLIVATTIAFLLIGTGALISLMPFDNEKITSGKVSTKKKKKRKNNKKILATQQNASSKKINTKQSTLEKTKKGTTPEQRAEALISAIKGNDAKEIQLLITKGVDVNTTANGIRPLVLAASCGNPEIVKLLINIPGININDTDENNRSAIFTAVQGGHIECLKLLLTKPEVDTNLASNEGVTPLMVATTNKHLECLRILLTSPKTDVNKAGYDGSTPLHEAAKNGYTDCIKLLLTQKGINVNPLNDNGHAPLHLAAQANHIECVRLLTQAYSIEINIQTTQQKETPMRLAAKNGNFDIVEILEKKGGWITISRPNREATKQLL